jgi:BirA family biotin operon repressor/biotin-[acetyl-CoA-carboxylase] ligase
MKFEIFKFKNLTSTNDKAMDLIKNKKKKSGFIFAKNQTDGRGTQGKKWISMEGNFFGSLFFKLSNDYPPFNEFSIINPVIVSDVLKKISNKNNIRLKFPNDIFINKKKVCGILQEVINNENKDFLIIGIGINVASNPVLNNVYNATNLSAETNKNHQINKIVELIITSYENFFNNIKSYDYIYYKKKANLMALN